MTFRIVNDVGNRITLGFSQLSCSESWIDSEYLANKESESSSDSLNPLKGKRNGSFSIDIGVEDTMNMLEGVVCVFDDQGHECGIN